MRNIDIWLTLFDLNNEKFRENFHEQKWQMRLEALSVSDMFGKGHGIMIRYIQPLHPLHMGVIEVLDNKLTDNEQNR